MSLSKVRSLKYIAPNEYTLRIRNLNIMLFLIHH